MVEPFAAWETRTHDPFAMQKVESSSLFIRFEKPRKRGFSHAG